ncbi:helix-turn-helix transcriptional regulator [Xenorhabdus anantnagensis]|uniref:Helix-turn-helix transcriptional regulator n=1 Tax=Xenorhabdus anantnagensis TaxID=3025875 RepID=A0ABT5LQ12_9GAMM|nr:helix-turn-helix transcriptional regulator [Xenorhabdus anantnagensis]MDC9596488.1 helix-turn-helix transcriptional regulator [Xenorhabdus anantnagensis]
MDTPLRKIRKEQGLTLAQVANAVDCDAGNLSRMERGIQKPALDLAEKLVTFFGRKISEIQILYPERFRQNNYPDVIEATNGAVQAHELRPDLPKVFPPPKEASHE